MPISSRTAEKHRNQATQLGVNHFLGKPYGEAELLQLVADGTTIIGTGTYLNQPAGWAIRGLPPIQVYEVASFYSMFETRPA